VVHPSFHSLPTAMTALPKSGRGLTMVSALSRRWGVTPRIIGKRVWCEMEIKAGSWTAHPRVRDTHRDRIGSRVARLSIRSARGGNLHARYLIRATRQLRLRNYAMVRASE